VRLPIRRLIGSSLLVAVAAVGLSAGSSFARPTATQAVFPTLYVAYTMRCTFSITDDNGKPVSSIAPGTYQVNITSPEVFSLPDLSGIFDMTACKGFAQFQLTGPGVSLFTTLQDGDEDKEILKAAFLPSSTYIAVDLNQPTVARATFSTSSAGNVALSPAGPSGTGSTTTASASGGSTNVIGAATGGSAAPLAGTLTAAIDSSGRLSLLRRGKPVTTLEAGRYAFAVTDSSKSGGFLIQRVGGTARTLSSVAFTGKRTVTVQLATGTWFYYGSIVGTKSTFRVA